MQLSPEYDQTLVALFFRNPDLPKILCASLMFDNEALDRVVTGADYPVKLAYKHPPPNQRHFFQVKLTRIKSAS